MDEITKEYGIQPEVRDQIKLRDKAASGDIVIVAIPATTTRVPTAAAFTRTVRFQLETAAGEIHRWFSAALANGVSVADTSQAGAATIVPATTLTFVDGVATVVLTGSAAAWLGGTAQVESITATAGVTSPGDITLTVTSALFDADVDVVVAITAAEDDVTKTAAKCVLALNADETVGAHFTATNVAGKINLTAKVPAANDATLAFTFADTDTTGVTFAASTNTTAGVAKETNTVTAAQATILGYTIAAATSVETISA